MYVIFHVYDVEDYGETITQEDIVAFCEDENIAKKYCEMHDRSEMYDKPDIDLSYGFLTYKKVKVPNITEENITIPPAVFPWTQCMTAHMITPDDILFCTSNED